MKKSMPVVLRVPQTVSFWPVCSQKKPVTNIPLVTPIDLLIIHPTNVTAAVKTPMPNMTVRNFVMLRLTVS